MNRFSALALAAAFAALSVAPALGNNGGHWLDTNRHMSLENAVEGSDALARVSYAKDICAAKTGIARGSLAGPSSVWNACMKAQGYVFLWDFLQPASLLTTPLSRTLKTALGFTMRLRTSTIGPST